jgi:tyrosine-protein kinase
MELKHYFDILRRWGWIMLLCIILAGVSSYWFSSRQPKVYEAQARYLVGPVMGNPNVSSNDLRATSQIGQTYAQLATSRPILQGVIDKLNLNVKADTLSTWVTTTWIDAPQILNIRVRAPDPDMAAQIANQIGEALVERSPSGPSSLQVARRQAASLQIVRLQDTIRSTQSEIDQLAEQIQQATDQVLQRALIVRLDQRRAQLAEAQQALNEQFAIVQSSETNQISVIEPAVPQPKPVAPDVTSNVLIALIAGLVLGISAMLLLEYFTDVVYTPEDLRKSTQLPYLAGIAQHRKLHAADTAQLVVVSHPETLAAESYRILRTNLRTASTDVPLASIMITSPSRGDGKSEIAANLAVVLAKTGKQVILIDANLRSPRISALFGVADQLGLSSLLDTSQQKLEPIPIDTIPGLSVVPAGAPSANSSEILGSERMYELIQEFKARAAFIILDSAPLLYSDTLALASQVDAVILAANSGTTSRENTVKAIQGLRLVGARTIGTVLNRVKPGPAYSYYPLMKRPTSIQSASFIASAEENASDIHRSREYDRDEYAAPTLSVTAEIIETRVFEPARAEPTSIVDEPTEAPVQPEAAAAVDEPTEAPVQPEAAAAVDEPSESAPQLETQNAEPIWTGSTDDVLKDAAPQQESADTNTLASEPDETSSGEPSEVLEEPSREATLAEPTPESSESRLDPVESHSNGHRSASYSGGTRKRQGRKEYRN